MAENSGYGLSMGAAFGLVFGAALGNAGLGLVFGAAFGIVFGASLPVTRSSPELSDPEQV
jgi:hypothetical protein